MLFKGKRGYHDRLAAIIFAGLVILPVLGILIMSHQVSLANNPLTGSTTAVRTSSSSSVFTWVFFVFLLLAVILLAIRFRKRKAEQPIPKVPEPPKIETPKEPSSLDDIARLNKEISEIHERLKKI